MKLGPHAATSSANSRLLHQNRILGEARASTVDARAGLHRANRPRPGAVVRRAAPAAERDGSDATAPDVSRCCGSAPMATAWDVRIRRCGHGSSNHPMNEV